MAVGGQNYCLSEDEVITFLTTNPHGYRWPQKTVLLMMANNTSHEVIQLNTSKFFSGVSHADTQAIEELRKYKTPEQIVNLPYSNIPFIIIPKPIEDIMFIMNYSPCYGCTLAIIQYCKDNPSIKLKIYFAGQYINNLKDLMLHPQLNMHNIHGGYWIALIRAKDLSSFWQDTPEAIASGVIWEEAMKVALNARGMQKFTVVKTRWNKPDEPVSVLNDTFLQARKSCDDLLINIVYVTAPEDPISSITAGVSGL